MSEWIPWAFAHYVLTLTLTKSFVAERLVHPLTSCVDRLTGYPFSTCRLCMGLWVAVAIALFVNVNPLFVWGLSQAITQMEPTDE